MLYFDSNCQILIQIDKFWFILAKLDTMLWFNRYVDDSISMNLFFIFWFKYDTLQNLIQIIIFWFKFSYFDSNFHILIHISKIWYNALIQLLQWYVYCSHGVTWDYNVMNLFLHFLIQIMVLIQNQWRWIIY